MYKVASAASVGGYTEQNQRVREKVHVSPLATHIHYLELLHFIVSHEEIL